MGSKQEANHSCDLPGTCFQLRGFVSCLVYMSKYATAAGIFPRPVWKMWPMRPIEIGAAPRGPGASKLPLEGGGGAHAWYWSRHQGLWRLGTGSLNASLN
jgi:hypothetical protein